jgi:hypothetical protein
MISNQDESFGDSDLELRNSAPLMDEDLFPEDKPVPAPKPNKVSDPEAQSMLPVKAGKSAFDEADIPDLIPTRTKTVIVKGRKKKVEVSSSSKEIEKFHIFIHASRTWRKQLKIALIREETSLTDLVSSLLDRWLREVQ